MDKANRMIGCSLLKGVYYLFVSNINKHLFELNLAFTQG